MNKLETVLIVDDNRNYSDMCKIYLENEGYKVSVAENGEQGLVAAKENRPGVILLDLMMPKMDGYQMLAIIKDDRTLKDIPVIVLTVNSDTLDVVKVFRLGASDYLKKPFDVEELLARIDILASQKHTRNSLQMAVLNPPDRFIRSGFPYPHKEKEGFEENFIGREAGFSSSEADAFRDFRNILLGIIGFIENRLARFSLDLSSENDLQFALKAAKHMKYLLNQNMPVA